MKKTQQLLIDMPQSAADFESSYWDYTLEDSDDNTGYIDDDLLDSEDLFIAT